MVWPGAPGIPDGGQRCGLFCIPLGDRGAEKCDDCFRSGMCWLIGRCVYRFENEEVLQVMMDPVVGLIARGFPGSGVIPVQPRDDMPLPVRGRAMAVPERARQSQNPGSCGDLGWFCCSEIVFER